MNISLDRDNTHPINCAYLFTNILNYYNQH